MTLALRSAARSDVGLVRSGNEDSGYAGDTLLVVADGMGGHAGGDVASSIAVHRLKDLDQPFATPTEAEQALQQAIASTATVLIDTVAERPELAGMGTTVSALDFVDDYAVIAHIGDSRIYLYRDDALTQITTDHTFVQRLVDSGRDPVDVLSFDFPAWGGGSAARISASLTARLSQRWRPRWRTARVASSRRRASPSR